VSEDGRVTDAWGDPDPQRASRPAADPWSYFPPPDVTVAPYELPPREPLLPRVLATARTFGGTVAVLLLTGAPLALVWRAVAPTATVLRTASGPAPEAPESNQVFATDGWFAVVMLLAGLLLGIVAWRVLREQGPAAPFGLAVGGLLAALVTAAVGRRMVVDQYLYDFCHAPDVGCLVYDGTLRLHALAAAVVLPLGLLISFVAMTFLFDRD
jgi:hypothetical protein